MKACSHYSFYDNRKDGFAYCSLASDRLPLLVNCTGCTTSRFPLATDHEAGRLDFYLLYMISGTMTVPLPDRTVTVHTGNLVFFPPGFRYRYSYDGGGEPLGYLWVHFTGSHAEQFLQELGFAPLPSVHSVGTDPHISLLFTQLFSLFHRSGGLQEHERACVLWQILLQFSSAAKKEESAALSLDRSLRYIHASYTEDIPIPYLAHLENLSSSRYHTLFLKQTGTSPVRYIARLRMQHACQLLRSTNLPVNRIGEMVGYRDPHFFSKLFKKQMGISPTDYRAHPHEHCLASAEAEAERTPQ